MNSFKVGIQLYTVREALKEDFKGTVRELAKMGYDGVEFAGDLGGMTPDELASFIKETGLEVAGMHCKATDLIDPNNNIYEYAAALGTEYMTCSQPATITSDTDLFIEQISAVASVVKGKGMSFTYHNHAHEFEKTGNRYPFDLLYANTDPTVVKAEIDTYWVKKGGEDPVAYLNKYAARLPQVHLKDMDPETGDFTEVGTGLMDLPAIFTAAEAAGAEWVIYEQDRTDRPSLESARISIDNIKKNMTPVA